jgi:hypothetical protein
MRLAGTSPALRALVAMRLEQRLEYRSNWDADFVQAQPCRILLSVDIATTRCLMVKLVRPTARHARMNMSAWVKASRPRGRSSRPADSLRLDSANDRLLEHAGLRCVLVSFWSAAWQVVSIQKLLKARAARVAPTLKGVWLSEAPGRHRGTKTRRYSSDSE